MAQTRIKPLERKVLRDTVYESLVDMLMSGALPPGAALSIDGLAHDLQVSPTPVREALVHLERTGLVLRAPLRGYHVAPPLSTDQISQLLDARIVLELGALNLAFSEQPHLAADLAKAHVKHEKTALAVAGVVPDRAHMDAYRDYMAADWAFHRTIFRYSRNDYLIQQAEGLPAHLHRLRQSVTRGVNDSIATMAEHTAVLEAVQNNDAEAAKAALHAHLNGVKERSMRDEASS
ncbi:GntR family transcriptional regulator [Brooklawnia cerclae]|uniref:DNA-binding GntR family transcriptional regulator n=1 Tax=Brooklawnia cerclae TaxID=349934 RepID=A0ABX0SNT4_9ACTN|nr:DNA-binding GntR family transcriptional regulator [Brooklawnia cerclae]